MYGEASDALHSFKRVPTWHTCLGHLPLAPSAHPTPRLCLLQGRVSAPAMMSRFNGDVWSFDNKLALFMEWDPTKARDYDNFNPFERNDEGAMCDTNGVFPGTDRGYKIPTRPDTSWAIMQEEQKKMEEIRKDPKFQIKGQPGNWSPGWQKDLKAPPS